MTEVNGTKPDSDFLDELEAAVRKIVRSSKASKADKLSAINAGTKLLAIRHKINGGDDDKGFFGR
jgi:hypothetical protein